MFGKWFGRKKQAPSSPLEGYDRFLEELMRQGEALRASAATLLSLRGELRRTEGKLEARQKELRQRLEQAAGDPKVFGVLTADVGRVAKELEATQAAFARAESDAQLLLEASRELAVRVEELRVERQSAKARLATGLAVSQALQTQSARIDQVLALDRARDEVERAQALADIYREEAESKR